MDATSPLEESLCTVTAAGSGALVVRDARADARVRDLPPVTSGQVGAYLGTPDELTIAGPVTEVSAEIRTVRAEAQQRKGWIMDTYLLRRRP